MNRFQSKLVEHRYDLKKTSIEIIQVNVGKLCNLTCSHCHVEAGPTKTKENMDQKTAQAIVVLMDFLKPKTLDLTGGAPEMNPHFRYLVTEAHKRGIHIIDRCNLTIIFEKGMEDLSEFLAQHQVEVIASLPCYSKDNVDKQRGNGTFGKSIEALQKFNNLGYGKSDSELILNLVYNPIGAHLPPAQDKLERDYKQRLKDDSGIVFNKLYTITNMPITRYAKYLKAFNQLESYAELLINNFNPHTLDGLMCRNTLNISWDGRLFDCDFNQMLGMGMRNGKLLTVFNVKKKDLEDWKVLTADHCFGCTAGAGSSCQGALK
ncbi:MAG: arsenosugar biosynthesis radical SAM protein ArsS [Candidatus Omnitrophica bacterium]|nr:arsenosugar biosynthesis radical SAM protein ArsS [Candidatus Omnitrophota bacterium]